MKEIRKPETTTRDEIVFETSKIEILPKELSKIQKPEKRKRKRKKKEKTPPNQTSQKIKKTN